MSVNNTHPRLMDKFRDSMRNHCCNNYFDHIVFHLNRLKRNRLTGSDIEKLEDISALWFGICIE